MRDVAIIGGMGAGKSTLCKALCLTVADANYVYAGKYIAQLPFALHRKYPDLFTLPRDEFLCTVMVNSDIAIPPARREDLNDAAERAFNAYGELIETDLLFLALKKGVPNIIDGLACVSNVQRVKDRGMYLVGLQCGFETQVTRRLSDRKGIDPEDRATIETLVHKYNDQLQVEKTMPLAHVHYRTDDPALSYSTIVQEIADIAQR